ncbi:putative stage V sporulation protein K [Firmicutes bacterium CAG:176]|nr:putative stage V sporulation protein K [Firmicutes bacterium CAG:176]
MDKKDQIILQQLDVIRSMTENNVRRMGSDFWGTPFQDVGKAPTAPGKPAEPEKPVPPPADAPPGDAAPPTPSPAMPRPKKPRSFRLRKKSRTYSPSWTPTSA